VSVATVGIVLGLFVLASVKRALDESRMRAIEARTGWDRTRGLRT
jgi:Tfp pilus assembly protein PilX